MPVAETVAAPVRLMPRLGLRLNVAVVASVALPIASEPAVGPPGAVPRAASALIETVPALMVVTPL